MKYIFISILFANLLWSCGPAHLMYPTILGNTHHDRGRDDTINLEDYTAYYKVIYRRANKLEEIYPNKLNEYAGDSLQIAHITDIQYILLNKQMDRFLFFSYIPTRYVGPSGYYLDRSYPDYNTHINLYCLNMLQFGAIKKDSLLFRFEKSRRDRNLRFSLSGNTLTTTDLFYPNKKKSCDKLIVLNQHFESPNMQYIKMESFSLKHLDVNDTLKEVKKTVVFSHFKKPGQEDGISGKNMILFEYVIPNGEFTHVYFHQNGERFDFKVPQ